MNRPVHIILLLLLLSAASPAQLLPLPTAKSKAKSEKAIKKKMLKAFGGKKHLENIEFMTYTLFRKAYSHSDTATSKQLWLVHMKKPLVIKLDITGEDTVTSISSPYPTQEQQHPRTTASAALLSSRFFNFLYLLTAPETRFSFIKQDVYKNCTVDIIRVNNSLIPSASLDLFVNKKGEVITSSRLDGVSGTYTRFGDEYSYKRIDDKVIFPLAYKVVQQGHVLAEGSFSNFALNKLSSFWVRRLALLGIDQENFRF